MGKEPAIQLFAEGKIDIHQRQLKFGKALETLEGDNVIIRENKILFLRFLRDCSLGKTILGRSKKKIGPARCLKYLGILRLLSDALAKPFDDVRQIDMQRGVFCLGRRGCGWNVVLRLLNFWQRLID